MFSFASELWSRKLFFSLNFQNDNIQNDNYDNSVRNLINDKENDQENNHYHRESLNEFINPNSEKSKKD